MTAAAKNLTPVILELGGQCPTYVDEVIFHRYGAWCSDCFCFICHPKIAEESDKIFTQHDDAIDTCVSQVLLELCELLKQLPDKML